MNSRVSGRRRIAVRNEEQNNLTRYIYKFIVVCIYVYIYIYTYIYICKSINRSLSVHLSIHKERMNSRVSGCRRIAVRNEKQNIVEEGKRYVDRYMYMYIYIHM